MSVYSTQYTSAEDILFWRGNTHVQIHKGLIVPVSFIHEFYPSMGVVEFIDGSAEYCEYEFVRGILEALKRRNHDSRRKEKGR